MTCDSAAEIVADELLYITGKALTSRDFEMFSSCFHLPQLLETIEGRRLISTEKEFRAVFTSVCDYLASTEVVDLARTVVSAEFLDSDTVGSTHVCSLLQTGGRSHRQPYPVYSIIKRFGRSWKIVSSLYVILDGPEHNEAIMTDPSRSKIES